MSSEPRTTDHGPRTTDRGRLAVVEPEPNVWDAFTQQHPQGHLLQSSGWGALKQQVGWEARRVLISDLERPRAGAQLLFRQRIGLSVAYVPRGPLFADDPEIDTLLLATLDRLARNKRAVFLRLEPNIQERDPRSPTLHSALLLDSFRPATPIQPRSTLHLDLTPPPERLLTAMSKGHRADIRRAAREGVDVRLGESPADLDAFYAIMKQTGTRAAFAIHSRRYYHAAWELFRSVPPFSNHFPHHWGRGQVAAPLPGVGYPLGASNGERESESNSQLLLAERAGKTLAAFLVFAWAGAGLYLYGGSTEEGLKSGANHALQWQAIQWARERGCTIYDFWGIPDLLGQAALTEDMAERARLEAAATSDPLFGVFRFKKGFGGQVVRYLPAYDRVYVSPLYALWRRRFGG